MRCEDCPYMFADNCDDRCPAVPTKRVRYVCPMCGENIYEGEGAYHFRGNSFCEDCYHNMSLDELAEFLNERGFDYD